jgi:hypothetical protein
VRHSRGPLVQADRGVQLTKRGRNLSGRRPRVCIRAPRRLPPRRRSVTELASGACSIKRWRLTEATRASSSLDASRARWLLR